jgi:hypothetical protein
MASGWPAGSSISVQQHHQRTGHANYVGRYVDGRGLQLHCTFCDARVHDTTPAEAERTATKGWGADRTATRASGEPVHGVDSFDPAPPIPVQQPLDAEHPPANFDG